jgi:transcriptional regulator with XRE-family HTH domain
MLSRARLLGLWDIRESRHLSQDELALISGLDQKTISSLERGERPANRATIQKLASALDVRPQQLIERAELALLAAV